MENENVIESPSVPTASEEVLEPVLTESSNGTPDAEETGSKSKEPKIDKDGRIDSRLPLEADLFYDIKKVAKILKMSKIALITQYVMEGYQRDLSKHKLLFQCQGFNPKYVNASNRFQGNSTGSNQASQMPEEFLTTVREVWSGLGSTESGDGE